MDGETYFGGYRCIMCDLNDEIQQDYSAFAWLIAVIHVLVHSVSTIFAFI